MKPENAGLIATTSARSGKIAHACRSLCCSRWRLRSCYALDAILHRLLESRMKPTRYFIDYDPDGTIALLARVRFDEAGIHGEYWENGSWIEHAPVADVLSDPSYSEEISSVKAHEIARSLGWDIGSDSGRSS